MDAIRVERLKKTYGSITAVDGLELTVAHGELFTLLGINGAGKSTTIKMLSCLTQPSEGDAFLYGKSVVREQGAVKELIGISPQETAVAPNLTARENLELMCGIHGMGKAAVNEKITQLSRSFHLDEILNRRAGTLSGGWQRRVSIAMALIGDPKVLFLDEPTLGLDVIARSELWDIITSLKGSITVVLTTHYMEEAEALSDRIGVMKNGRLIALGTCEELKAAAGAEKLDDAFVALVRRAEP